MATDEVHDAGTEAFEQAQEEHAREARANSDPAAPALGADGHQALEHARQRETLESAQETADAGTDN